MPATRVLIEAEYVLPLRWHDDDGLAELTTYLEWLSTRIDVTVVDGSASSLFTDHAAVWSHLVRHLPVDGSLSGANGKVRGVLTGVAIARHEAIVLADDDVRYTEDSLAAVVLALHDADLVRPQNYFSPLPWHARWDTARSLINRSCGTDYPGTYAVRRSALQRSHGYDADVLFENLEMERCIRAHGGRVKNCPNLFVARLPPTTRHFWSQRVRQAYDSLAQPARFAVELSIAPAVLLLRRRPLALAALALSTVIAAGVGRVRSEGRRVFGPTAPLWAPLWVAERGATAWLAFALAVRGGVRYGDGRIRRAAHSARFIASDGTA